jgi:hypothetical protein
VDRRRRNRRTGDVGDLQIGNPVSNLHRGGKQRRSRFWLFAQAGAAVVCSSCKTLAPTSKPQQCSSESTSIQPAQRGSMLSRNRSNGLFALQSPNFNSVRSMVCI